MPRLCFARCARINDVFLGGHVLVCVYLQDGAGELLEPMDLTYPSSTEWSGPCVDADGGREAHVLSKLLL